MKVRVLLAEDQTVVRAGFRALLDGTEDLVVVGEAENGREAIALARSTQPDVVLMDIRMPVMDGLEATRIIGFRSSPRRRAGSRAYNLRDRRVRIRSLEGRGKRIPVERC